MEKARLYLPGTIFTLLFLCATAWTQEAEPVRLVDSPTAGLTSKGRFGIDLRLFSNGGVTGQVNAGILKRIAIGLSYGGTEVIGDDEVSWYPRVEAAVRYRMIEESPAMPGVAIGYETQGYGAYEGGPLSDKIEGGVSLRSARTTPRRWASSASMPGST